jgi:hypothetical protein
VIHQSHSVLTESPEKNFPGRLDPPDHPASGPGEKSDKSHRSKDPIDAESFEGVKRIINVRFILNALNDSLLPRKLHLL